MKKNIAIAVAALLAAVCFTGCSAPDTVVSDTTSAAESTEAATEEASEEATEEATEEETKADSAETEDATEEDLGLDDLGDLMGSVEAPKYNPGDAAQDDFVGLWEGDCIVEGDTAYNSVFGIPVSAMMQFEIKADGTGVFGSGLVGEDETDEDKPFTWTYADNAITFTFEDGEDGENPASALISDGKLVIAETEDSTEAYVYFNKVDKFSEFDMTEFYNSMGLGDIAAEFEASEDSEDSAASDAE